MDVKCVRVLRPYDDYESEDDLCLYVDEDARWALNRNWGERVEALGRRRAEVRLKPLRAFDQQGFIARGDQKLIDALYIEYGEEILLG